MMRIPQGADWGRFWPLANPDGSAITDWTGWTALAQVRDTPGAEPVLWSWATGGTEGTASFGDGGVTLAHTGADSEAWAWRLGVWDLRVTNSAGKIAYVARGRVMVAPAVTRD